MSVIYAIAALAAGAILGVLVSNVDRIGPLIWEFSHVGSRRRWPASSVRERPTHDRGTG